jgi:hypothetical protein
VPVAARRRPRRRLSSPELGSFSKALFLLDVSADQFPFRPEANWLRFCCVLKHRPERPIRLEATRFVDEGIGLDREFVRKTAWIWLR